MLVVQVAQVVAAQIVAVDLQVVAVHFAQAAFVVVAVVGLTLDNLLQWAEIRSFLIFAIRVLFIYAITERNKRTIKPMNEQRAFGAIADFLEFEHVNVHDIQSSRFNAPRIKPCSNHIIRCIGHCGLHKKLDAFFRSDNGNSIGNRIVFQYKLHRLAVNHIHITDMVICVYITFVIKHLNAPHHDYHNGNVTIMPRQDEFSLGKAHVRIYAVDLEGLQAEFQNRRIESRHMLPIAILGRSREVLLHEVVISERFFHVLPFENRQEIAPIVFIAFEHLPFALAGADLFRVFDVSDNVGIGSVHAPESCEDMR